MKHSTNFIKPSLLSAALFATTATCLTGPFALADGVNSIADAFTQGESSLNLRYRYEFVDQSNSLKDANVSTLKTRLNFKTKSFKGFSLFVEADHVSEILSGEYNDGTAVTGNTNYSVVVDPTGTDLNQSWVQYKTDDNQFRFGRQRILLDNQRFVGGVGWRQNEQTYDSFVASNSSIKDVTATFAYIWNVNRIFGTNSPKSDIEGDTYIFNVAYTGLPFGKLSAYSYLLDAEKTPEINTKTTGIRLAGSKLGSSKNMSYEIEYATQSDYDSRVSNLSADYFHVNGNIAVNGFTFGLGYEVLTGDATNPGQAFTTPLATLHKFNGWADQFLGTPSDGLEDVYVSASTKLSNYKLTAIYHDFSAENSNNDYGSEFDAVIARQFGKNYTLLVKYAAYSAGDIKVDTNKLWVMFTAAY